MASSRSRSWSNPVPDVTCVCQPATRLSQIRASDKTASLQVAWKVCGGTLGQP